MSDRTGVDAVGIAVLETLAELGRHRAAPHVKCAAVLGRLAETHSIAPRHGYDALCAMAAPWCVNVPLVDFHGNLGSADRDDEPAGPRYAEARLTAAGELAVAGERGSGPRLPVGLMNGDKYLDGTSPPFAPERVAALLLEDVAAADATTVLGPPSFPTGCAVDVDVDALAAGDWVELTCSARLSVGRGPIPTIVVTNLPPGIAKGDVGVAIAQRAESRIAHLRDRHAGHFAKLALPIGDVRDESSRDETRIVCELAEGTDVDDARDRLADTYGMVVRRHVQLRRPLAELVQQYTDADRDAQRTALQAVLDELGAASTG